MKTYKLNTAQPNFLIPYKESLNQQQLDVVEKGDGPALVLAGAGSGKTRVLIYRLAYLLEKGINPANILLVTFTNKASQEMIHRAQTLLKSNLSGLWAGTFHSIGNRILRREAHLIGYTPSFTIVDRDDAHDLLQDCIDELGFLNQGKLFPKKNMIATLHGLALNSQQSLDTIIINNYPDLDEYAPAIKKVVALYEAKKKQANVMDFDDLLLLWLKILEQESVRNVYAQSFKYILVDEYQDTNKVQFEILKQLSSFHKNILVVGDDAQSIYSFRGAEINNILLFPKIFPETKIFKLETNYRSTPQILALANDIITHNSNQFEKTLHTDKPDGQLPLAIPTKDVYMQAQFVCQRMQELNSQGISFHEMAVLFRSRFQAMELELELVRQNIPYIIRGGVRFFEQAHIKDTMSYMKIIINPHDELAFKRALCLHQGIGKSSAQSIWEKFHKENKKLSEIEQGISKRQKQGLKEFIKIFEALQKINSPQSALSTILDFYKHYCYLSFENPDERLLDLEELSTMALNYATIKEFILELNAYEEFKGEIIKSSQERTQAAILTTIHQAKGLEWETVFLIGFNDYDFPHPKALLSTKQLEEERRLFYVAATRAKSLLHIIYPQTKYTLKNGPVSTSPSMFFYELSSDLYEEMTIEESY